MDLHTTSEELAKELDVPLISVAPSVHYSLQVNYALPHGDASCVRVAGPWGYILEMLQNGPVYWDTVDVIDIVIKQVAPERHYNLGRDNSDRDCV